MSRKRKVRNIIIGIVVIFGVAVILIIRSMPYESRYYEKLGVTSSGYRYSDMLRDFGEPKEISVYSSSGAFYAVQNEFSMMFGSQSDDSRLLGITITGKKYRFGWLRIGVGSTNTEVLRAYANVFKCTEPGCAYIDGDIMVEFFFDKNNMVKEIQFHNYTAWGP